jgi:hypothetical protein
MLLSDGGNAPPGSAQTVDFRITEMICSRPTAKQNVMIRYEVVTQVPPDILQHTLPVRSVCVCVCVTRQGEHSVATQCAIRIPNPKYV